MNWATSTGRIGPQHCTGEKEAMGGKFVGRCVYYLLVTSVACTSKDLHDSQAVVVVEVLEQMRCSDMIEIYEMEMCRGMRCVTGIVGNEREA
jgi:hypothetical protein